MEVVSSRSPNAVVDLKMWIDYFWVSRIDDFLHCIELSVIRNCSHDVIIDLS
jgi:hypothetical protein